MEQTRRIIIKILICFSPILWIIILASFIFLIIQNRFELAKLFNGNEILQLREDALLRILCRDFERFLRDPSSVTFFKGIPNWSLKNCSKIAQKISNSAKKLINQKCFKLLWENVRFKGADFNHSKISRISRKGS